MEDLIEWSLEVLDYLQLPVMLEEAVSIIEVKDNKAPFPKNAVSIIQIVKLHKDIREVVSKTQQCVKEQVDDDCCITFCNNVIDGIPVDCQGAPLIDVEITYYRPYLDMSKKFFYMKVLNGYDNNIMTPVRKSSSNIFMFNNECVEKGLQCKDEYKILLKDKHILFNFSDYLVAIFFYRPIIDCSTGLPMIIDDIRVINAIAYYVKWKVAEVKLWLGDRNAATLVQYFERQYRHYLGQARNWLFKPKTIDDFENILQQTSRLIPRKFEYKTFFSNLNGEEKIKWD